jgi:hypothetical protein
LAKNQSHFQTLPQKLDNPYYKFADQFGIPAAQINAYWLDVNTFVDGIDPLYAVIINFTLSLLSFTK